MLKLANYYSTQSPAEADKKVISFSGIWLKTKVVVEKLIFLVDLLLQDKKPADH